mgnify:CR=1 FL=1
MTTKQLAILLGAAAVLGGAALWLSSGSKPSGAKLNGKAIFPKLDISQVARVELGDKLKLASGEKGWTVETYHNYPADHAKLTENLLKLTELKVGQVSRGKKIENVTTDEARNNGFALITEERRATGIFGEASILFNSIIANVNAYGKPFLNGRKMDKDTDWVIDSINVKTPSKRTHIKSLSGGNQQKVIIAREVQNDKDLLIAVNPTRGLDVGAIEYVHKYIVDQRNKGKAVLLVSFELDEIMSLSDIIDVIFDGQIVAAIPGKEANENDLGLLMAGGEKA